MTRPGMTTPDRDQPSGDQPSRDQPGGNQPGGNQPGGPLAGRDALCLLATEWWKASRRLLRLAAGDASAPGRFERERAQLAYAGRRVAETLEAHGLRLRDFDGQPYSPALPPEPVNPEDFDTEEGLVVADTIEPTVLHDGRIVLRGKVALRRADG